MSENNVNGITGADVETTTGIIGATVGIGQYIINDYVITIAATEGDYGYTMTITRGTETQTVTLYGLTQQQYDAMLGYLQQAQEAAQNAQTADRDAQAALSRALNAALSAADSESNAAEHASESLEQAGFALQSANNARAASIAAQSAQQQAQAAQTAAETAAGQITGMTAEAETLAPGSEATAEYNDGVLSLGIPQGVPGEVAQAEFDELEGQVTELKSQMDDMDDRVTELEEGGSGLTVDIKEALLQFARKVVYIDADGRDYYNDLRRALYPTKPATAITLNADTLSFSELNTAQQLTATLVPIDSSDTVVWASSDGAVASVNDLGVVTALAYGTAIITATAGSVSATCSVTVAQAELVSISAIYTQSGIVYDTDSIDSLKSDLVVTAYYDNQTTATITDYTLSGTLTAGTSTITVTYRDKTTTFTVTVTHMTIDLDTIVYEDKSYRDIFMTGNQLIDYDFENGVPAGMRIYAGQPSVSDDDSYSSSHSLKCFGSSSQQMKGENVTGGTDWNKYSGKYYFIAYKGKCVRYVKGWLGINGTYGCPNITSVTDGWVTQYKYNTSPSGQSWSYSYLGSGGSADLDGYIDDIVFIPMTDIFTILPTEAEMLKFYNEYCDLRKAGES